MILVLVYVIKNEFFYYLKAGKMGMKDFRCCHFKTVTNYEENESFSVSKLLLFLWAYL